MPRDERTYITVHDGMPEHPKVEGLSDAAFRLMVETWCWCSRNRTDGKVREASWLKRGTARARAELLAEGLVEADEDGVMVHDYTEHQRTAAEIDELSARRKAAGAKGGKASASARANGQASAAPSAQAESKPASSKTQAESETDTEPPSTKVVKAARKRAARTHIPKDWRPGIHLVAWSREHGIPDETARKATDKFVDHWVAKGELKADWDAAWRNWLRTDAERASQNRAPMSATEKAQGWLDAGRQAQDFITRQAEQHALPGGI